MQIMRRPIFFTVFTNPGQVWLAMGLWHIYNRAIIAVLVCMWVHTFFCTKIFSIYAKAYCEEQSKKWKVIHLITPLYEVHLPRTNQGPVTLIRQYTGLERGKKAVVPWLPYQHLVNKIVQNSYYCLGIFNSTRIIHSRGTPIPIYRYNIAVFLFKQKLFNFINPHWWGTCKSVTMNNNNSLLGQV